MFIYFHPSLILLVQNKNTMLFFVCYHFYAALTIECCSEISWASIIQLQLYCCVSFRLSLMKIFSASCTLQVYRGVYFANVGGTEYWSHTNLLDGSCSYNFNQLWALIFQVFVHGQHFELIERATRGYIRYFIYETFVDTGRKWGKQSVYSCIRIALCSPVAIRLFFFLLAYNTRVTTTILCLGIRSPSPFNSRLVFAVYSPEGVSCEELEQLRMLPLNIGYKLLFSFVQFIQDLVRPKDSFA